MRLVVRIVLLVSVAGACTWGYWYAVILPRQLELGVLNEEITVAIRARAWDAAGLLIRRHRLMTSALNVVNQWQNTITSGRWDDQRNQEISTQIGSVWYIGSPATAESLLVEANAFMEQRYDSVYSAYWSNFSTYLTTVKARIAAENERMSLEKRLRRSVEREAKNLSTLRDNSGFYDIMREWNKASGHSGSEWALDEGYDRWRGRVARLIRKRLGAIHGAELLEIWSIVSER